MNMKQFAHECGVSAATVSYALRNDSRISEAVRTAIQQKAKELNYSPDARGKALVRYRTTGSTTTSPKVAVLYAHPKSSRRTTLFQLHIKNFKRSITPYGYKVSEFYLGTEPNAAEQLIKRLRKNNIRGFVIAWGEWQGRLESMPWEEFSVISAERNIIHKALDRISLNHFSATEEACHQLRQHGAQRIGLICHSDLPGRVKRNIVGSYLLNIHQKTPESVKIQPYFYTLGESPEAFKAWYEAHKPDAILSHRLIENAFFQDAGIQFPRDAQFAVIEIDDPIGHKESGVMTNEDLGSVIAETLAGKLHYDEKVDLTSEGNLILVDGEWHTGESTRN